MPHLAIDPYNPTQSIMVPDDGEIPGQSNPTSTTSTVTPDTGFNLPSAPQNQYGTADAALRTGAQINPSDRNSVNRAANLAIASSAPPYTPLVSPGSGNVTTDLSGNQVPTYNTTLYQQAQQAFHPESILQPSTTLTYNPIQERPEDILNYKSMAPMQHAETAQGTAAIAPNPTFIPSSRYDATQARAAHGEVDPRSLIQNQFTELMRNSDADNNGVPDWAQTAVTAANQRMNALGLGASTMAGGATAAAILNTALPMAQFNANLVATLNLQNLSNDQQTLLSNAAWDNAAKQFNAQSEQQNNQFFTSLTAQIADQNANRITAMSQFNAGQRNTMTQFKENLDSQREEFNTQNQLLVDQSNVQWRRTINTANTMGQNAVNQANVMNTFNVSQTALNNLWQQARDEASWALTSSENSQNRALSLVNSSLNRQTSLDILNSQMQAAMFSQLGGLAVNVLGGLFGGSGASGIGKGISNLFASNSDTSAQNFVGSSASGGGDFGTAAGGSFVG